MPDQEMITISKEDLIMSLEAIQHSINELKLSYREESYDSEHCLQDAYKSYGFFTVCEAEFKKVNV